MAILELVDVEKRFGGLPALAGVTFSVDEGEIVALVGPNGAGKTTLLKAIGGMQPPSRGTWMKPLKTPSGRAGMASPPVVSNALTAKVTGSICRMSPPAASLRCR